MTSCSVWKERGKHAELTLLFFMTTIIIIISRFSFVKKETTQQKTPNIYGGREGGGDKFTTKVSKLDTNK